MLYTSCSLTTRHTQMVLSVVTMVLTLLMLPFHADATWSIVAVDSDTGEVGVAGATCGAMVWEISGLVPGFGVIVAQANTNLKARDLGVSLLAEGQTPEEILAVVTDPAWDAAVEQRQYGIAALSGSAVSFTGSGTPDWHGSAGSAWISVQGNSLRGSVVVESAYEAFVNAHSSGLPMAEQLLLALEAGSVAGGDERCSVDQTARSAFLFVVLPNDTADHYSVKLKTISVIGSNPVTQLVKKYNFLYGAGNPTSFSDPP